MLEERQQAYLEAMGIPVWVSRNQAEVPQAQQIVEPVEPEVPVTQQSVEPVEPEVPVTQQSVEPVEPEVPAAQPVAGPPQDVAANAHATDTGLSEVELSGQTVSQGLKLGPGSGGVLLVCGKDSDSASKLGNDISRVLPNNPVWGWPHSEDNAVAPLEAVNENLFTCVAVFGDALAQLLFDKQVPAALGSATVVILPAMSELEDNAEARRKLWSELCRSGMIVA